MDLSKMKHLLASLDIPDKTGSVILTTTSPPQAYSTEGYRLLPDNLDSRVGDALWSCIGLIISSCTVYLLKCAFQGIVRLIKSRRGAATWSGAIWNLTGLSELTGKLTRRRYIQRPPSLINPFCTIHLFFTGTDETDDIERMEMGPNNCSSPHLLRRNPDIYPVNRTFPLYSPGIGQAVSPMIY